MDWASSLKTIRENLDFILRHFSSIVSRTISTFKKIVTRKTSLFAEILCQSQKEETESTRIGRITREEEI